MLIDVVWFDSMWGKSLSVENPTDSFTQSKNVTVNLNTPTRH